jgi:glutathione S-transferase
MPQPEITLHALAPSHPCMTVAAALERKGLTYERVDLPMTGHNAEMERIYGEGNRTVPGALIDGEPIHGSVPILERLEEIRPDPPLYPEPIAADVHAAERWGDGELQDLGRRFPWGALRFRPEYLGIAAGGDVLDPAGTDYAIRFVHAAWKYHGISCERLAADLEAFPAKLDQIEALAEQGTICSESPNAADLQIGATMRVILSVADLEPLIAGRAAQEVADRWFPDTGARIPAGAFPASWLPVP